MIFYESTKLIHGRPYKNSKYVHLGAFIHFKPKKGWEKIIEKVESLMENEYYTKEKKWKSTPSIEPLIPEYIHTNKRRNLTSWK